jgi:hypothetical protein
MIVFNLQCAGGHGFEEWFVSSADFEARMAAHQVACPECGGTDLTKAVSAPRVNGGASAPAAPCGLSACAGGTCQMMGRS